MTIVETKPLELVEIPGFWEHVQTASSRFLGLDYDGTLAPFQVDRMEAHPLPGVIPALEEMTRRAATEVAIISGRPIAELQILLGDFRPDLLIGSHGCELAERDGAIQTAGEAARMQPLLEEAFRLIATAAIQTERVDTDYHGFD